MISYGIPHNPLDIHWIFPFESSESRSGWRVHTPASAAPTTGPLPRRRTSTLRAQGRRGSAGWGRIIPLSNG